MEINQDPVEADHLFVKAMRFSDLGSDENHRALLNRQRTSVIVEEIDLKMLKFIDDKKKAFLKINRNSAALKRAKKEAYFQVRDRSQTMLTGFWPFLTPSPLVDSFTY